MKRSMMQCYVNDSVKAVETYMNAFNAKLVSEYKNDDGSYLHAELDIEGQILALSHVDGQITIGNSMQFCLHYHEEESHKIKHAYDVLKINAVINDELGPCFYSDLMTDFVDEFGIHWCLFI